MEVSELLKQAWGAVEAASLPESIQPKAFEMAVRIMSEGAPTNGVRRQREKDLVEKPIEPREPKDEAHGSLLAKLSHESGVDVGDLEEVIYFDAEGSPHVTGPARKLGKSMSEQARRVALLVTASRALALDEIAIASKVIREECSTLKCFDQNNFGKHTASAPGLVTVGNGQSRTFKLKAGDPGLKAFREAIDAVRGVKAEA